MSTEKEFAKIVIVNSKSNELSDALGIAKERAIILDKLLKKAAIRIQMADEELTIILEDTTNSCENTNELAYICFSFGGIFHGIMKNIEEQVFIKNFLNIFKKE